MSNIRDVAKLANVSVSTVSNIINNKNNVSSAVYKNVMEAIETLNYTPNLLARNLKTNKIKFIGVILPNIYSHYNQIVDGILKAAEEEHYHLIIKTANDMKNYENMVLEELIDLGVKGILIITCNATNTGIFDSILSKKIPIVFLERIIKDKDYNSISFDNFNTIYEITENLLNGFMLTHSDEEREIVLVTGHTEFSSEKECENGFKMAFEKHSGNCRNNILHVSLNREYSFKQILYFISQMDKIPDCFITSNEVLAENLIEILGVLNKKSEIYSLSGDSWYKFDNRQGTVKLKRNATRLGIEGMNLLIKNLNSPILFENKQILLKNERENSEMVYKPTTITDTKKEKINLLLLDGPMSEAMLKLIPNFEDHFGVSVDYRKCHYIDLYNSIIESNKMGKSDFDVFLIDLPWIKEFVESGCLLKIDDFIKNDNDEFLLNFNENVRKTFIDYSSSVYTFPLMVGVQMMFYRRDLLEDTKIQWMFYKEYGIELKPPKTWSEFNLVAKFFTRKYNSNSPTEYGTCIAGLNPTGIIEEFLPRQWSYNGRIITGDGEFVINSIENIKALNSLCETYRYCPVESIDYWWDDQIDKFVKGNVAFINTYNSHVSNIYDRQVANMFNNIKSDAIPGNASVLGGWVFGINKYSKYPKESYEFMKWACSNSLSVHNTLLGGFVPKNNVVDNSRLSLAYPWMENISTYLDTERKKQTIRNKKGKILDMNLFEKILADGILDAVAGRKSPEETLSAVKDKFEQIVLGSTS